MNTIEVTGPVGAGKSAFVDPLASALLDHGVPTSKLGEVVSQNRLTRAVWSAAFVARHPRLVLAAVRAVSVAPIPWWHRRIIIGLVLSVGARLLHAQRHANKTDWIIVDEGLVHRAVNLFAWGPDVEPQRIEAYLRTVPAVAAVVVVEAPFETALERATQRGLPKRLIGRSPRQIREFLARTREILQLATERVESSGVHVVRVDNERSLTEAALVAAEAIAALTEVASGVAPVSAVYRPRFPQLPRPDRMTRRVAARRRQLLNAATVGDVLNSYGIRATAPARSVASPGGRGRSSVVDTASGRLVVKEYKSSTTVATVELEHAVLNHLERRGVAAPRLVMTGRGRTWVERDNRFFALFEYLDGYHHPHEYLLMPSDRAHIEALAGAVLGDLHSQLVDAEVPSSETLGFAGWNGTRVRPIEWFTATMLDAQAPSEVRDWAGATLRRLSEELDAVELSRTVVHGDYGPFNLLVRRGMPPVVVDWELARIDWRLADLAKAVPYFAQRRTGFSASTARRFLAAYRDRTGISAREISHVGNVAAFLAIQRSIVAWTRASASGPRGSWVAIARRQTTYARELVTGAHPFAALTRN